MEEFYKQRGSIVVEGFSEQKGSIAVEEFSKQKGSVAVEAVFVVPICLMVCFFLISILFYTHHVSWYSSAAWESVLCGLQTGTDTETAGQRWKEVKSQQVFPVGSVSGKVSANTNAVTVTITGKTIGFFGFSGNSFRVSAKRTKTKPAAFIRKTKAAKTILQGGN